jgi:hypothetical protein
VHRAPRELGQTAQVASGLRGSLDPVDSASTIVTLVDILSDSLDVKLPAAEQ